MFGSPMMAWAVRVPESLTTWPTLRPSLFCPCITTEFYKVSITWLENIDITVPSGGALPENRNVLGEIDNRISNNTITKYKYLPDAFLSSQAFSSACFPCLTTDIAMVWRYSCLNFTWQAHLHSVVASRVSGFCLRTAKQSSQSSPGQMGLAALEKQRQPNKIDSP